MVRKSRALAAVVVAVVVLTVTPSSAGTGLEQFHRHGIAFQCPGSWFVTTRPLSNGVNPIYRFTVSSSPVRRTRADEGPCLPGVARQLPQRAVLAYLREALGSDRRISLPRVPRRPRSFRLPTSTDRSLCGFDRGRWITFKESGRVLYLGVYVGPRATALARQVLARLLNRMGMEPR